MSTRLLASLLCLLALPSFARSERVLSDITVNWQLPVENPNDFDAYLAATGGPEDRDNVYVQIEWEGMSLSDVGTPHRISVSEDPTALVVAQMLHNSDSSMFLSLTDFGFYVDAWQNTEAIRFTTLSPLSGKLGSNEITAFIFTVEGPRIANYQILGVPEPSTLLLAVLGSVSLPVLALIRRR